MKLAIDRNAYPFDSRYFTRADGTKQHYIDEGAGPTIVFVHGTPSWSFDFRNVVKSLRDRARCVAVDHVGFGLSDKPPGADYGVDAHVKRLEALISALNLGSFSLALHDFGGPIGLELAYRNPDRVNAFCILNSRIGSAEDDPEFQKLKTALKSPVLPFLYRYMNFSPRFLMPASFGARKLSPALLLHYRRVFPNPDSRYGPLAFARSLLDDQKLFEAQWQKRSALSDKKAALIWGMADKWIGKRYLTRFQSVFPLSKTLELPDAGHFPQEERPDEVSEALAALIDV